MPNPTEHKSRALAWARSQTWAIERTALDLLMQIAARQHDSDMNAVLARQGEALSNSGNAQLRNGVAIIDIIGPIFRYANFFTQISGATSIDTTALDFRAALDDPRIRAVVLNIDSPGGTVTGISDFAKMVKGSSKPTIAFVGGTAASAAYWIASAAQWIAMSDTALVGSIGVVADVNVTTDPSVIEVVSSQSPGKRPDVRSDTGRAQIQKLVDDTATIFINAVASNRNVPTSKVLSDFGKGGMLIGSQAVAANMADQVSTLEKVLGSYANGGSGPAVELLKRVSKTQKTGQHVDSLSMQSGQDDREKNVPSSKWDNITARFNNGGYDGR